MKRTEEDALLLLVETPDAMVPKCPGAIKRRGPHLVLQREAPQNGIVQVLLLVCGAQHHDVVGPRLKALPQLRRVGGARGQAGWGWKNNGFGRSLLSQGSLQGSPRRVGGIAALAGSGYSRKGMDLHELSLEGGGGLMLLGAAVPQQGVHLICEEQAGKRV